MAFTHIAFESGALRLLDQAKLPATAEYVELRTWESVADAIARMIVRGAPAIGIAGAYGMAIAARGSDTTDRFAHKLESAAAGLTAARPTAINLAWAVGAVHEAVKAAIAAGGNAESIAAAAERAARDIHEEDVAACNRIGDFGAALLPRDTIVLTHCNTGTLATGGYGTALGIVRSGWRDRRIARVFVSETRPLFQGARLTAWELAGDGIPHTLIADSMAAHFMRRGGIGAVVVGADRIARNGDVANKIGTYGLAVLARAHEIPFIVAAPRSTFDLATPDGDAIPIEERDPREMTHPLGVAVTPPGTRAANPAFDVTPAALVTAIVTEAGVLKPPFDRSICDLFAGSGAVARGARS